MVNWLAGAFGSAIEFLQTHRTAIFLDLVLTAILTFPIYDFLSNGWKGKRSEINTSLSTQAKRTYLKVFQHRDLADTVPDKDVETDFDKLFLDLYGRSRYLIPILLLTLVSLLANYLVSQELIRLVPGSQGQATELYLTPAAIAGAYTFVTFDFYARMQSRDFPSADIMRGALRLAIAIPLGYTLGQINATGGAFLAFAIGVFPLRTVATILRQLAGKRLQLDLGAGEGKDQVGTLSDVDATIAERIEYADITTIAQLAWCDPIQLSMRTFLGFTYIVDLVSQSLARVYLDDKLAKLKSCGLRGASEIHILLLEDLKSTDPDTLARAKAVLPEAAAASGIPQAALLYAFEQIAYDPNTKFLYEASE